MNKRLMVQLGLLLSFPLGVHAQSPGAGAGRPEDQAGYVARCVLETVTLYPSAAPQAQSICGSKWDMIVATSPFAEAVVSLAPVTGASVDAAGIRTRASTVQWRAMPDAGFVASGRLGDIVVNVEQKAAPTVTFDWTKPGETIPFDLEGALKVRGSSVTMVGCLTFGSSEGGRIYRVEAPGRTAFSLSISFREAAVANQSSSFIATADYSGRVPTLAELQKDGNDWTATCPR